MHVLRAVIHREGTVYVAHCDEVGTTSQGATIEDAVASLQEATELYLEEFPAQGFAPRFVTTFEVGGGTER